MGITLTDFFQKKNFLQKVALETLSELKMVWIQIRTDIPNVGPDLDPNRLQRSSADNKIFR